MQCDRCNGLMLEEQVLDLEGTAALRWTTVLRCVSCAHFIDPLMAANRPHRNQRKTPPEANVKAVKPATRTKKKTTR